MSLNCCKVQALLFKSEVVRVIIVENNNIIMPFDVNNPGRYTDEFITDKVGNVSGHDYKKFEKGMDSKIVYMTCNEYIQRCMKDIFNADYDATVTNAVDRKRVNEYANDMKNGDIFPLPYLNYVSLNQEGRHRMIAFEKINGKSAKAPVLVIFPTETNDEEIKKYVNDKWGSYDEEGWIRYIKGRLNMLEDDKDEEIDSEDDSELYLNYTSDEDENNEEDEIEFLSKKSGLPVDKILGLNSTEFMKLVRKYIL